MNHKNFDFTQIPGKTKDVVFLKSPKTMFCGLFLPDGDFLQKIWLSHTTIYGPLTLCQVLEKPIPRKLTDRRKDGQKEGQTDRILQDSSGQGRRSSNLSSASD